jgi:hypothetical protein
LLVGLLISFAGNAVAYMLNACALACSSQVRLFLVRKVTEGIGPKAPTSTFSWYEIL